MTIIKIVKILVVIIKILTITIKKGGVALPAPVWWHRRLEGPALPVPILGWIHCWGRWWLAADPSRGCPYLPKRPTGMEDLQPAWNLNCLNLGWCVRGEKESLSVFSSSYGSWGSQRRWNYGLFWCSETELCRREKRGSPCSTSKKKPNPKPTPWCLFERVQPSWLGLHLQDHVWRSRVVQDPRCSGCAKQGRGCRASALQCLRYLLPFVVIVGEKCVGLSWVEVIFLCGAKKVFREWFYICLKVCGEMCRSFCVAESHCLT